MNRWYDKCPNLGARLNAFQDMDQEIRDPLLKGVMELVQQYDPRLLSYEKAFDFPLNVNRLRWYDKDPYIWMMFNTLKEADDALLHSVEKYLVEKMPEC